MEQFKKIFRCVDFFVVTNLHAAFDDMLILTLKDGRLKLLLILKMTQGDFGQELRTNNDKIVECILLLREQREELAYIIGKQYEERKKLETEMERITYKLCLVNFS